MSDQKSAPETPAPAEKKATSLRAVLWTTRLEQASKSSRAQVREVLEAIRSRDRMTRWMSFAFLVSSIALVAVITVGVRRWWALGPGNPEKIHAQSAQAKQVSEFIKKQSEEAKTRAAIVSLGKFIVELKDIEVDGKPVRRTAGVMNLAEVELILDCGERETRVYVEEHMPEVRNQITNVLIPLDREEIISRDGKKRLRKRILDRLNSWLPHGKVQDVVFNNLIVS